MPTDQPAPHRPFPWTCPECGKKEVVETVVPYTFEANLNNSLLKITIPHLRVPKCIACGEMVFDRLVNEQVSNAIKSAKQDRPNDD